MRPLGRLAFVTAIIASSVTVAAQSQRNPTVPELLAAAAKYLDGYEKQFSAVVSEERYQQSADPLAARGVRQRILRSDLIVINAGQAGWISLRDVYEVDGLPVRDRADRLMKLVTEPAPDSFAQALRVAEESARFNLGTVWRTINTPTTALMFLRRDDQDRSTFKFEGLKTVDGVRVAEVAFKETTMPRMIQSVDNAAVEGKFWIEPASGRVVQTEFRIASAGNSAKISVRYAHQPKVGLWLPVRMDEEYLTTVGSNSMFRVRGQITGRADYQNFRKFDVDVATIIK
jgi:hypothetical protein